ncbi:hypothetical protein D7Z54_12120 [Salibacterium salarium]|uniref:Uncharacterized protein n=1 Tax=Salibacterium salarium TaxID=284579 RepID=A0A3R9PKV8_9BACI|nr:hypothetical protein [Salibacterium salarium]RSL33051.1 hypothetical protein D7Z54_12120 [Salibacterium salarium]
MKSWLALLKKEFLLTRTIFLFGIGLIFVVLGISYAMQEGYLAPATDRVMLIGMTAGILMHFIYLPVYMIISMQKELGTLHLWLHSPQPMYRLISAKMISGVVYMIGSLLLNGAIVLAIVFNLLSAEDIPKIMESMEFVGLAGSFIVVQSFYLGLFVLLFISLYLVLRKIFRGWSWLIVIALFVAFSWMSDKIMAMTWYEALTQWGEITIHFQTGILKPLSDMFSHQLYFGDLLFHFIIMVVIFVISTVLIDRKVEV